MVSSRVCVQMTACGHYNCLDRPTFSHPCIKSQTLGSQLSAPAPPLAGPLLRSSDSSATPRCVALSGFPAGCLGCTFPALACTCPALSPTHCTCPALSPTPVGSRAEPSTLDYSVFILNCLLQILIPIFAKYLTLDKLLHLSRPRFLIYKVGMLRVPLLRLPWWRSG